MWLMLIVLPNMELRKKVKSKGYWIETFSGVRFDLIEPKEDDILIEDIAHALSNLCRFSGHTKVFYSVAQHSLMLCDLVEEKYRLQALLHDASEAYLSDIPSPLKFYLPEYRKIEDNLIKLIFRKFKTEYPISSHVHLMDKVMVNVEHVLLPYKLAWYYDDYINPKINMKLPKVNLYFASQKKIEKNFLNKFSELTNG